MNMKMKILDAAQKAIEHRLKYGVAEDDPIFIGKGGKLVLRYDGIRIKCEENSWGEKVFEVILCLDGKEMASMKSGSLPKLEGYVIYCDGLSGEVGLTIT